MANDRTIFRVDTQFTLDEQTVINTWLYRLSTDSPNSTAEWYLPALLGKFDDFMGPEIGPCLTNRIVDPRIKVTYYNVDPNQRYTLSGTMHFPGTQNLPNAPAFQSAVITRRTNRASRKLQGRVYLAGFPIAHITGGVINDATPTWAAMLNLAVKMRSPLEVLFTATTRFRWDPVIAAIRTRTPPALGWEFDFVSLTVARRRLGVQRRRLPGHGARG